MPAIADSEGMRWKTLIVLVYLILMYWLLVQQWPCLFVTVCLQD